MNKTYEELFGEDDPKYGRQYPSYDAIVAGCGEIVIVENVGSYQGDSFYLIKDGERYGYVSIGWGSCSGCDALEACYSKESVMELAESIENDVKWFDDKAAAAAWFEEHDWAGDWSFYETKEFVRQAWELLGCKGSPPSERR